MLSRRIVRRWLTGIAAPAAVIVFTVGFNRFGTPGEAQLVAFQPLTMAGANETCEWEAATPQFAAYAPAAAAAAQLPSADARMAVAKRPPLTFIQDPYPSFSSIAVDAARNEIVMTDENRFRIMVYDRTAVTPASAEASTPKRVINGLHTHTQYASDVYIDPPSGDIYVVNNDTVHNTTIWGRTANGDAPPDREFISPYGNFGAAVDESRQEMYFTLQHNSAIMVFKKNSGMKDTAVRLIQGDKTRMGDPHGIAFDPKNRLLYVANYGTSHSSKMAETNGGRPRIPNWPAGNYTAEIIKGTGKFELPSITVIAADATGDVAPLRVIQGLKTGMNWPTGVAFDADKQELYVANQAGDAILVFSATQQGDVAPIRTLKGPKTLMKTPSDVFLDFANKEMWVASYGNHLSALVYTLGASGDAAPVRVVRGAPMGTQGTLIGNPYTIAYDANREQILVPSCVAHPRVAAFARTADKNAVPVRSIEGNNTHLNRTVHGIFFDALHDELVVNSDIGQAIMTFRGSASGNEAPIRIIQGPKTGIGKISKVTADPANNEVITWLGGQILFWDRLAQGDVAPKRVLGGPNNRVNANNVAVDPIHNLLIVTGGDRISIYERTASGDDKPLRVITGMLVGNGMTVYPPNGKILVNISGAKDEDRDEAAAFSPEGLASDKSYLGIWSIYDNGNVAPQWTIAGPQGHLRQPRGVTVDAKHQNVIVSDKYLNGVLTYHFPELFQDEARQTARAGN